MAWQTGLYRATSRALVLVAPMLLRKRLRRGKEDPARWREKMGEASLTRPEGPLVWLHAVGLGEVLALRGLIEAMAQERRDLNFLVTSSARSSGQVMAQQLPPRTQHQFLPLDVPQYLDRFLAHWRPSLSIWAEQDLWPNAVISADRNDVPLAMVNARMNAAALQKRLKGRAIYADLLQRFRLIAAQDAETAQNLQRLGAGAVEVTGSLKAAAPALAVDEAVLRKAREAFAGRPLWLLASSHPEDEAVALAAAGSGRLLVIAPRDPPRAPEIAAAARAKGLKVALRSLDQSPQGADVYIADTYGEMGLWYRLCPLAVIGGTFGPTEGHNPWEPAALGCAVLHGPRVANFAGDYAQLQAQGAVLQITPEALGPALLADHSDRAAKALALSQAAKGSLAPLARAVLKVMQ